MRLSEGCNEAHTISRFLEAPLRIMPGGEHDDFMSTTLQRDCGIYDEPFRTSNTQIGMYEADPELLGGLLPACHDMVPSLNCPGASRAETAKMRVSTNTDHYKLL